MTKRGRFIPSFPAEGSTAVTPAPALPTYADVAEPHSEEELQRRISIVNAERHPDIARLESIAALTGGKDGTVDHSGNFTPEAVPGGTFDIERLQVDTNMKFDPKPLAASSESPEALRARLAAIPQETLRKIAAEHQGAAVTLPDGSLRFPAIIPPEICEVVRAWAEGAGMDFDSYMQQHILTCLTAGTLA